MRLVTWLRRGGRRATRRARAAPTRHDSASDGLVTFADLELDPYTRQARRGPRPIELTPTECRLLELLLRNPGQVLTRELIFDRVWGFDFGPKSNILCVYVGYLRRKTEAGSEPRLIHTVRGVGYVLRDHGEHRPRTMLAETPLRKSLANS